MRFLNEVEEITNKGLVKTYHRETNNQHNFSGKLLVSKNLTHNLVHKELFFVEHTVYDKSHIMNRLIFQTLEYLQDYSGNHNYRQKAMALSLCFPSLSPVSVSEETYSKLVFDRKTRDYETAISLSKLILLNNMPDLSAGGNNTLALLFDMNKLWEKFIFCTLRRYLSPNVKVSAQARKIFWETKIAKPDIVVEYQGKTAILDTKWKIPEGQTPADGDLHQMFVYHKLFNADKVALVYPSINNQSVDCRKGLFYDQSKCDMLFIPIPSWSGDGKLWQKNIANLIENWM